MEILKLKLIAWWLIERVPHVKNRAFYHIVIYGNIIKEVSEVSKELYSCVL